MTAVALVALAALAHAQGDREGQGLTREQMWPAPTAEDWKKPVLITFQRTWKDALAVSKETGKPILICINMDGEIASEHYAGVRYRQPEVAKLYSPYVCVIASTYRHNPRDYDEQGNRILCPRFGSVTCGEHIWIEPILYEKYMDGQRVAPRHICIDLDGKETYDVFYVNDTAGVFDAIRDRRPAGRPTTVVRGDRPILERVASRDIADRNAVETAYKKGDAKLRNALLEAALKHKDTEQLDLMRLAVFGLDVDASRTARKALAQTDSKDATGLISDALRVPMDGKEREALIAALQRIGKDSPLARWLAGAHRGLGGESKTVDVAGWTRPRGAVRTSATGGVYAAPDVTSRVESSARASQANPDDPDARLALAEGTLALATKASRLYASNPRMAQLAARHLYSDAVKYAEEAEQLGAKGWRVDAVHALATYYGGNRQGAYERAGRAVKALPAGEPSWSSMAVLTVFAEGRWKQIKALVKEGKPYPPEFLTDLHAAYSVLLKHPLGTDKQVLWHYDLLVWLRVYRGAHKVLDEGIARFRNSTILHEKLRERSLRWRGPDGLEAVYTALMKEHDDPARIGPYAGYASFVAGDAHRRRRNYDKAMAAYGRAIGYYGLALAARARVAYQLEQYDKALDDIVGSLDRAPKAAGTRDGMGITPGETAQMLLAKLKQERRSPQTELLDAALKKIDPELLRPDIGLTGR
jgi:tetratricopeptide (TPR) repeat protein